MKVWKSAINTCFTKWKKDNPNWKNIKPESRHFLDGFQRNNPIPDAMKLWKEYAAGGGAVEGFNPKGWNDLYQFFNELRDLYIKNNGDPRGKEQW